MGVRPPSTDDSEAELIEFGIAALDARLTDADIEFPATTEEVIAAVGDQPIEYDASGNTIDLARALDRTDRESFDSEQDLLNALHPVFEDLRNSAAPGLLGWIRSLFS